MASVTMHVYVPAVKLVAVWVVLPVDHKYAYGGVPPLGLTVAVAVPPKQLIGVVESAIVKGDSGCEISVLNETIQLFASVTVYVYVPAVKLVAVWVVLPVDHKYAYGGVPPVTETCMVPLFPPLHDTLVDCTGINSRIGAG